MLDKAVAILDAVAESPASLAELVERTGLPRATAHRLAVALEVHRLVAARPRAALVPARAAARRGAPRSAEPPRRHLDALRDDTGESAQFYVRRRRLRGSASPPPSGPAGCATPCRSARGLPMTAGSAAHVLLAFAPADEVTPLLPAAQLHRAGRCSTCAGAGGRTASPSARPGSRRCRRRCATGRGRARRGLHLRPGRAAGPTSQPGGRRRRPRCRGGDRPRRPLKPPHWTP